MKPNQVFLVALIFLGSALDSLAAEAPNGKTVSVSFKYQVTPKNPQLVPRVTLTTLIPRTLESRQKVTKVKYSIKPAKEYQTADARYATFVLVNFNKPVEIAIDVELEIYRYDFGLATAEKKPPKPGERIDFKRWLAPETFLEKDAREIQQAAKQIPGKEDVEKLQETMKFVQQSLKYTAWQEKDSGALKALKEGQGDCSEYADLFVALCRAKNIAARTIDGYMTTEVQAGGTPKHCWAEVYLKDYGWIPFDGAMIASGSATFESLKPVYIYMSNIRNDATFKNLHYWTFRYEGQNPVEIKELFVIGKQGELGGK